jgi:hypothetical protein
VLEPDRRVKALIPRESPLTPRSSVTVIEAARNLVIEVTKAGSPVSGANVCLGLQANDSSEGFSTSDASGVARCPNKPGGAGRTSPRSHAPA